MKKFYFSLFFIFSLSLFAASPWEYREETRQLLYQGQPFPPYHPVVCPLGTYDLIPFASNPFEYYGWKRIAGDFFKIENESDAHESWIKREWLFSPRRPANLPQEWIYFPQNRLWASPHAFLKLYRLFTLYFESLPALDFNIHNRIEEDRFYRVQTDFLAAEVVSVEASFPDFVSKAYQGVLKAGGRRAILIFYAGKVPEDQKKEVHHIILHFRLQNGGEKRRHYLLISQNDTKLMENSF